MPPVMKSIQQKHVTDHRATYCYKPQRAILIIALQKISRFVFNGVPSKRFSFIKLHFYYTMNMEFFKCLWQKSVTPEMNRKHTSNQKPVFIFSTVSLFWFVTQKQQKKHPKSAPLRFRFGFYQFLHCSTVALPASPKPPPSKPALFAARVSSLPVFFAACAFLQLRLSLQIYQKNFQKNIDIRS